MILREIPIGAIRESLSYLKGSAGPAESPLLRSMDAPLVVIPADGEGGFFDLVDGFKRLRHLRRLGAKTAPAIVQPWDLKKAKAMTLALNFRRKTATPYEEAALVADLHRREGLSPRGIAALLRRRLRWVETRLRLATSLCQEGLAFFRAGRLGPRLAGEIARLPRDLQVPMLISLERHRLSSREVEAAVSLILSLPEGERAKVIGDPRPFLKEHLRPLVRSLFERGRSIRQIARGLGIHRKTVRRLLKPSSAPPLTAAAATPDAPHPPAPQPPSVEGEGPASPPRRPPARRRARPP